MVKRTSRKRSKKNIAIKQYGGSVVRLSIQLQLPRPIGYYNAYISIDDVNTFSRLKEMINENYSNDYPEYVLDKLVYEGRQLPDYAKIKDYNSGSGRSMETIQVLFKLKPVQLVNRDVHFTVVTPDSNSNSIRYNAKFNDPAMKDYNDLVRKVNSNLNFMNLEVIAMAFGRQHIDPDNYGAIIFERLTDAEIGPGNRQIVVTLGAI
jgi:hypothetical protein